MSIELGAEPSPISMPQQPAFNTVSSDSNEGNLDTNNTNIENLVDSDTAINNSNSSPSYTSSPGDNDSNRDSSGGNGNNNPDNILVPFSFTLVEYIRILQRIIRILESIIFLMHNPVPVFNTSDYLAARQLISRQINELLTELHNLLISIVPTTRCFATWYPSIYTVSFRFNGNICRDNLRFRLNYLAVLSNIPITNYLGNNHRIAAVSYTHLTLPTKRIV